MSLICHIKDAHNCIVCVTPSGLTIKRQFNEISLLTTLNALPQDGLHHQLISQKDMSLKDAHLMFLHTDRDAASALAIKSTNIAFITHCHHCDKLGHLTKDCPLAEQFR